MKQSLKASGEENIFPFQISGMSAFFKSENQGQFVGFNSLWHPSIIRVALVFKDDPAEVKEKAFWLYERDGYGDVIYADFCSTKDFLPCTVFVDQLGKRIFGWRFSLPDSCTSVFVGDKPVPRIS